MTTLSITHQLADYLKAHPGEWVDGRILAERFGFYAWRSRVSDARTKLGLRIENRQRKVGKFTKSEYRFVPATLLEMAS